MIRCLTRIHKSIQLSFGFSDLDSTMNRIKKKKLFPKTEIVSLNSTQLSQLATIVHYQTSIGHLQKNQLDKSEKYLLSAFNECVARYPESVFLQIFLINRLSIVQKLMNQTQKMIDNLDKIFLMCLSLKGDKSLDTIKHLRNYLIALIIHNPGKAQQIIESIKSKYSHLFKKCINIIGVIYCLQNEHKEGLRILEESVDKNIGIKYANMNNIGWLKLMRQSKGTLEPLSMVIKREGHSEQMNGIVLDLLGSLVQSEKLVDKSKESPKQLTLNLQLISQLSKMIDTKQISKQKLMSIQSQTKLFGINSHIIAMNIANTLFLNKKLDEALFFNQIGIQAAIENCEPERVGLAMVLLSKMNFVNKFSWEPILENILNDQEMYSLGVIKQCLITYSNFLMVERRYYQAQDMFHQANQIKVTIMNEGLILPDFDFSF